MTVAACRRPGGLELTGRLLAAVALPPGAAVLDVGCGAGATVAHLADEHGLRATGVDSCEASVARASRDRPDRDFVAGRAERLPFPDASFDAVLFECVLSTLPDPGGALGEALRVLRPGGVVLVGDVYARRGAETDRHGRIRSLGSPEAVADLFAASGLEVSLWEDTSDMLGRYVWEHGAAAADPPSVERRAPRPGERRVPRPMERRAPGPGARLLGYFICVARRGGS